jgi:hypothetical protein
VEIPEREPDYVLGAKSFWWKEKIQTNSHIPNNMFIFILEYKNDNVLFKGKFNSEFIPFFEKEIKFAYKKWLISKHLKEKLK